MNLKKTSLSLILICSLAYATPPILPNSSDTGANASSISPKNKTKLKAPLMNLFQSTDWGLFFKEFKISLRVGFCGKGLNKAIGFKAHMIEPIGYFEDTAKPLYFPFANLNLGGNIMRSGFTRSTITSGAGRDEFVWSHFIYVPIFGLIFKKKIPIFCFANGSLTLPLISEFMPPYSKDIEFKNLIMPMVAMFTPQGLISTILDCAATETSNEIHGFGSGSSNTAIQKEQNGKMEEQSSKSVTSQNSLLDKGEGYLRFVRDTMYFSVGCLGFAPVGGYIAGQNPGTDTELLLYEAINLLQGASSVLPAPFLYKQTNFSANTGHAGIPNTMCAPSRYPLAIESQYVPQRAFPTVGGPHELGASPITTTVAANVPGSKDSFVYVVWERRDYYAFAYACPGK